MNSLIHYAVPAIAGSLVACLGPVNGALQDKSGVWGMALLVHLIGLVVAGVGYSLSSRQLQVLISGADPWRTKLLVLIFVAAAAVLSWFAVWRGLQAGLQWYAYLGGVFAVIIVICTVESVQRIGVLPTVAIIMIFEILAASVIDYMGLFHRTKMPLSPMSIVSIVIILAGIILNVRSR